MERKVKNADMCPNSQDQKLVKVVVGRDRLTKNKVLVLELAKIKDPVLFDMLESGLRDFWSDVPSWLENLSPMDADLISILEADEDCAYERKDYMYTQNYPYIAFIPKGKRFILEMLYSEDDNDYQECLTLLDDLQIFKA